MSDALAAFQTTPPPPSREGSRGPGRPRGQRSEDTRGRILDAAEHLFADRGYDGASIRDVAAAAGVQVHAVGYHFGPKDELFDAVVARRAAIMTDLRRRALADLREASGEAPLSVADMIRAYVTPFIQSAGHGEPGWRNYAALMGRLANSPVGTEIIAKHYDETARAYVAEFARALPGADPREIVSGFLALVAAMLSICARTGRADRLSNRAARPGGAKRTRSPAQSIETLVRFHTAGFSALSDKDRT
ncbi:MAG: TetR/AcrR family transcriptional regulator [Pseudomonadota bacterium]